MLVIGLSGKIGCGKTTVSRSVAQNWKYPLIRSFATLLKEETSEFFNFPKQLCYSEEGKNTTIDLNGIVFPVNDPSIFIPKSFLETRKATVRELMQWYGTDFRRAQDGDYWVHAISIDMDEAKHRGHDLFLIDDVRFPNEAEFIHNVSGTLARIHPHNKWVPGPNAEHYSEIALDNYHKWNLEYAPQWGDLEKISKSIVAYVDLFPKCLINYGNMSVSKSLTCR